MFSAYLNPKSMLSPAREVGSAAKATSGPKNFSWAAPLNSGLH